MDGRGVQKCQDWKPRWCEYKKRTEPEWEGAGGWRSMRTKGIQGHQTMAAAGKNELGAQLALKVRVAGVGWESKGESMHTEEARPAHFLRTSLRQAGQRRGVGVGKMRRSGLGCEEEALELHRHSAAGWCGRWYVVAARRQAPFPPKQAGDASNTLPLLRGAALPPPQLTAFWSTSTSCGLAEGSRSSGSIHRMRPAGEGLGSRVGFGSA